MAIENMHKDCDKLPVEVHREFERRMEETNSWQNQRIDRLERTYEQIAEINTSVKIMAENMVSMTKELEKTSTRLERLEDSAITSAQLNGFGARLDSLEKLADERIAGIDDAINSKLKELAKSTADQFEELERNRWRELEEKAARAKDRKETVIKTVLGILATALAYAVIRALLPNISL